MSLSAADLQKRHELEGAPDPFPSLVEEPTPRVAGGKGKSQKPPVLDTSSEASFPSLAPTPTSSAIIGSSAQAGAWGNGPRLAKALKTPTVSDSFSLGHIDLRSAGKDGKPTTLGEVMKTVMAQTKATIEASSQKSTGQTTFVLKGDSEREVEKAKRLLAASLSPVITQKVEAPISTIGSVIGVRGATLKQIRDQTNVKIDIPQKKDTLAPTNGNGTAHTSRSPSPGQAPDEDEEEPTVPISISGPAPSVHEAIAMIKSIIGSKVSRSTQRIKPVASQILPFIDGNLIEVRAASEYPDSSISVSVNAKDQEIIVSGEKEAVLKQVETIKEEIKELEENTKQVMISIPRRQHRLVTGGGGRQDLLDNFGVVVLPHDSGDQLVIWGAQNKLGPALSAVLDKANSQEIRTYDVKGPLTKPILIHLIRSSFLKTLASNNPGVHTYPPSFEDVQKGLVTGIDLSADNANKNSVTAAIKQLDEHVKQLQQSSKVVEVDWLLHKTVSKQAKKIKQLQDTHSVAVHFPADGVEQSTIFLIHDLQSTIPVTEKQKHLEEVARDILKIASEAADVKVETISVETKWHAAIAGQNNTTLNAIIGEDQLISIKIGKDARTVSGYESSQEDIILIRGPANEVKRAVDEINALVEEAKNDEISSGYTVEFEIAKDYVPRLVGAQGATVKKLRETLGVKIDFTDESEDKEWADGKKKKKPVTDAKAKVKIVGREKNVEDAKKRILAQVEKLADETTEVLRIPRQYHSGLIGASGKYVIRLEEKYGVRINFPRDDDSDHKAHQHLKPDEVLLRGGRKGVAAAKSELMDAVEFEKANNNTISFTVPTKAVSRILGKGGASINDIKERTDTQIDVDDNESTPGVTNIAVRGTAPAIKEAKAAILEISNQVEDEVTEVVQIENKYHRNIIGKGGEALRELIVKCGGPTDPKSQAFLIHFPRQGETPDEVTLRGEKTLVKKLKTELEKTIAAYKDRVIVGVAIPAAQHRALIGRGGQNLMSLQEATGTQIWFPGSRSYHNIGEPSNADELADAIPEDIVKVNGPKASVAKAIEELDKAGKASVRAPRTPRPAAKELLSSEVEVPQAVLASINQHGNLIRALRGVGVSIDNLPTDITPQTPSRPTDASAARIDDVGDEAVEWQVIDNSDSSEDGTYSYQLRGPDQESLDKAKTIIEDAVKHVQEASHVGFLTLPNRSSFPRIVGAKGANVARLRDETGAEITVSRDDNVITIVGSKDSIEAAKAAILSIAQGRRGGRRDD